MMTRPRTLVLTFAFALLLPLAVQAQHFPTTAELTDLIETRIEEGRAIGIVLGVMEADGSTTIVSAGDAGPDARPLGEESLFEIGSITKAFTGVLLAEMAARGEVSLSDPVSNYLPDDVTIPTRGGREITLQDLATHHSALPRMPSNFAPADPSNPYADYTVSDMYEFLSDVELTRDIGSEYEYSNLAVGLLGHVLASVGGADYEDVIRERVLNPLGMYSTTITLEGSTADWMAQGHNERGQVVPLWDLPTLAGAGALRSNVADMLTFLAANVGEPNGSIEQAMRESHGVRESLGDEMSVGLNWHVRHVGDADIVWHNGGTAGFRTFMGFDPEAGVGAVVLTNSGHGADDIGFHLINPELPLAEPPVAADEETIAALYEAAEAWVRLVIDGDAEAAAAQAHPAVASQMTAEMLAGAWAQLGPQLGELQSMEPKEQGPAQGMNLVVLTGVFANGTFDVQVYMDDEHQVAGFFVQPPGG